MILRESAKCTGALLGAQSLGETATEAAKRIDTVAALLNTRQSVAAQKMNTAAVSSILIGGSSMTVK